tara:strand:- start:208 stop:456 length:249 start_codon:yes stop_codon:yes gene_type:complete
MLTQVSKLVKDKNLIDSKSFNELSPLMKEAISDVFKMIEKETGSIIEKFENSVEKVSEFHNVNIKKIYDYFDNELIEQLGEK